MGGIWFGELSGTNTIVIKMSVKNTTNIDKVASPLSYSESIVHGRIERRKRERAECGSSFIYTGAKPFSASEASPLFRKPLASDR